MVRISKKRHPPVMLTLFAALTIVSSTTTCHPSDSGSPQTSDSDRIWTLDLPDELKGAIYQAALVADDVPFVLATTSSDVLRIEGDAFKIGNAVSLFHLEKPANAGERMILPSPAVATTFAETPVGIALHEHRAITRFRLVTVANLAGRTLKGEVLADLPDRRHFHYLVAPDGQSFVGLDSGGEHTRIKAKRLIYRFFTRTGRIISEVPSSPAPWVDSSYSPDGRAFLINSKKDGLSSYDPSVAKRIWNIPGDVKFFAAANGKTRRVLVVMTDSVHKAHLYEAGNLSWTIDLKDSATNESVRNVAISPNGELAVVSNNRDLLILGASSSALQGRYRVGEGLTINSVVVSNKGLIAVGAQQAGLKGAEMAFGKVFVLDKTGKLLFQENTQHQRSNAWTPIVQIDPSGRFLLVRTVESLHLRSLH